MSRLGSKVLLASVSAMLLLVASCALVVVELTRLDRATALTVRDHRRALLEGEIRDALTRASGETANYVQSGDARFRSEATQAIERANDAAAALARMADDGAGLPGTQARSTLVKRQESLLRLTEEVIRRVNETATQGRDVDTAALLREIYAHEDQADALWQETAAGHRSELAASEQVLRNHGWRIRMLVLASAAAMLVWLGVLIGYVRLRIVRPLTTLADLTGSVAAGDLTRGAEVSHNDELGQLQRGFNCMIGELRTQRDRLAELVDSLSKSRDIAEKANRAKSDFLLHVSHEVRTPMSGVLATLDLMHETATSPEQRDLADVARHSARNLLWMINELLDYSRIETGKMELHSASFDLHELLTRTVELHRRRGLAKGLAVSFTLAPDVPARVLGDASRLGQILQNLLDNAVKFTDKGSIDVSVSLDPCESTPTAERPTMDQAAPVCLRVQVADTGVGVSGRLDGAMLRPFEQARPEGADRTGGLGLGLVIAQRLAHLMGGKLEFEGAPGRGSRFWFTVRLQPDSPSSRVDPTPMRRLPAGKRVLLAEDNQAARQVLARTLERRGLRVTVAENGSQALALAAREPFDLVLMDCQMPEMDGFAATRAIRALDGPRAELAIVAVTAYGLVEQKQRYLDAGFDDLLTKPYTVDELDAALHRWLLPKQLEAEGSQAGDGGSQGSAHL